jgi:hypothetical protein
MVVIIHGGLPVSLHPFPASWCGSVSSSLLLLYLPCCALQLALEKDLNLKQIKFFVIDECDKVLEKNGEQLRQQKT